MQNIAKTRRAQIWIRDPPILNMNLVVESESYQLSSGDSFLCTGCTYESSTPDSRLPQKKLVECQISGQRASTDSTRGGIFYVEMGRIGAFFCWISWLGKAFNKSCCSPSPFWFVKLKAACILTVWIIATTKHITRRKETRIFANLSREKKNKQRHQSSPAKKKDKKSPETKKHQWHIDNSPIFWVSFPNAEKTNDFGVAVSEAQRLEVTHVGMPKFGGEQ